MFNQFHFNNTPTIYIFTLYSPKWHFKYHYYDGHKLHRFITRNKKTHRKHSPSSCHIFHWLSIHGFSGRETKSSKSWNLRGKQYRTCHSNRVIRFGLEIFYKEQGKCKRVFVQLWKKICILDSGFSWPMGNRIIYIQIVFSSLWVKDSWTLLPYLVWVLSKDQWEICVKN